MASTMFIVFLCLSVYVASGRGQTDVTSPGEGPRRFVEDPMIADENEGQQQSVNNASFSTQLAAQGLAQLLHRMAVFSYSLNLTMPPECEGGGDCGREQRVREALAELVRRMVFFSRALNSSFIQPEGGDDDSVMEHRVNEGLADLVRRMTLFSHALNLSSSQPEGGEGGGSDSDWEQRVNAGLAELVHKMTLLSESLTGDHLQASPPSTGVPPSTPASNTSTPGFREQPCLPPFDLIAYRMCILQEMDLKLSWNDAQEFCRERGAELAGDMTVTKARRFLNGLYGEDGTRSRWPVWVGGRKVEQTWRWTEGIEVPDFLWAPDEPRVYSRDLMPEGLCMFLDGYRRFHGASLPCHLRRRFICQLRD